MSDMNRAMPVSKTTGRSLSDFRWVSRVPFYVVVIFFCIIVAFPVYWMIVSTIQPVSESLRYPPPFFPRIIDFGAFEKIFFVDDAAQRLDIWIRNTFILASLTTVICIVLTVFGAYALSGRRWRGQGLFGLMLLMTQMLPEALIVIPLYSTMIGCT